MSNSCSISFRLRDRHILAELEYKSNFETNSLQTTKSFLSTFLLYNCIKTYGLGTDLVPHEEEKQNIQACQCFALVNNLSQFRHVFIQAYTLSGTRYAPQRKIPTPRGTSRIQTSAHPCGRYPCTRSSLVAPPVEFSWRIRMQIISTSHNFLQFPVVSPEMRNNQKFFARLPKISSITRLRDDVTPTLAL